MPTLWGWLVLLLVAIGLSLAAARHANWWLSVDQPARGADARGAQALVVEGWLGVDGLDQALRVFRHGHYRLLLTSGGPTYEWPDPQGFRNYAERAADYLRHHGLTAAQVVAVPTPASAQDRTFLSAVMVRDWVARSGMRLDAIDVFSFGAHTRRSRMLYRMAFGPKVEVGALAAQTGSFDADRWWTNSSGVKLIMGETLSIVYTVCCFWPAPAGSQAERWADAPAAPAPSASASQRTLSAS